MELKVECEGEDEPPPKPGLFAKCKKPPPEDLPPPQWLIDRDAQKDYQYLGATCMCGQPAVNPYAFCGGDRHLAIIKRALCCHHMTVRRLFR